MDFILLMHDDADEVIADSAWPAYFAMLRDADAFDGGSEHRGWRSMAQARHGWRG